MTNKSELYWRMGEHFLRLAHLSSKQLVRFNNRFMTCTNEPYPIDKFQDRIAWSDHIVGVPTLFNFYHGIELMLKGTLQFKGSEGTGHKLTALVDELESFLSDDEFLTLIKSYTKNIPEESIIHKFNQRNEVSIDDWYQSLKYPESTRNNLYSHQDLQFGGENTLPFWDKLSKDSLELIRLARSYTL